MFVFSVAKSILHWEQALLAFDKSLQWNHRFSLVACRYNDMISLFFQRCMMRDFAPYFSYQNTFSMLTLIELSKLCIVATRICIDFACTTMTTSTTSIMTSIEHCPKTACTRKWDDVCVWSKIVVLCAAVCNHSHTFFEFAKLKFYVNRSVIFIFV